MAKIIQFPVAATKKGRKVEQLIRCAYEVELEDEALFDELLADMERVGLIRNVTITRL